MRFQRALPVLKVLKMERNSLFCLISFNEYRKILSNHWQLFLLMNADAEWYDQMQNIDFSSTIQRKMTAILFGTALTLAPSMVIQVIIFGKVALCTRPSGILF